MASTMLPNVRCCSPAIFGLRWAAPSALIDSPAAELGRYAASMNSSPFDTAFAQLIAPVLDRLGFKEIPEPPGWMIPSKLYLRDKTWFGAESDWRDGYIAVTIGRLFRIRDFLPRAIVRGPYHYEVSGQYTDSVAHHLRKLAAELPEAIDHIDERWPLTSALERERWCRSEEGEAGYARYLTALGPELTDWPLADPAVEAPPPNER